MKQTACDCDKCQNCCKNIPGIPTPNEILKQAKYLKLSVHDYLNKFCVAGYRDIDDKHITFAYPARKGYEGTRETWGYPLAKGDCIFLKKGKCVIHPVKPFECKHGFGCEKHKKGYIPRTEVLNKWWGAKNKGTIHEDIIKFIE